MMYQTVPQSPHTMFQSSPIACHATLRPARAYTATPVTSHLWRTALTHLIWRLSSMSPAAHCTTLPPNHTTTQTIKLKKTTTLSSLFQGTRLQPRRKRRGCCRVLYNFHYFHSILLIFVDCSSQKHQKTSEIIEKHAKSVQNHAKWL